MWSARYFSYVNQIWGVSPDIHKRPHHEISWKSVHWVSCWYVRLDGRTWWSQCLANRRKSLERKKNATFGSFFLLLLAAVTHLLNSLLNRLLCTLNCVLLPGNETAVDIYIYMYIRRQYGLRVVSVQREWGTQIRINDHLLLVYPCVS